MLESYLRGRTRMKSLTSTEIKALERKVLQAAMARYVEWVAECGRLEVQHRTLKLRKLADACERLYVARTKQ